MSAVRATLIAVVSLCALVACTPGSPPDAVNPSPDPQSSESPAPPAPNPTMPAFGPDQVVLTISATATAPNGASMDVKLETYYPVEAGSPEAAQIQAYLAFVGSGGDFADPDFVDSKKAILQVSKLTATAANGVWPSGAGVLPTLGPGKTDTLVDIPAGPVSGNRLSITGPGHGFGVGAIYSEDGSDTPVTSWAARFTSYGFSDAFAGTRLTNCSISFTPLGSGSSGTSAWTSHNCYIGRGD